MVSLLHGRVFGVSETDHPFIKTLGDQLAQPYKRSPADKQDVCGVDGSKFLVGVLATALGRNIGNAAFENLEQGLLDSLPRNIPGD